jgi:hypothetical protein
MNLGVGHALAYNAAVFAAFLAIFLAIDFDAHFRAVSGAPCTTLAKLYFVVMNHAAAGANDIVPVTDAGRALAGLHVATSFVVLAVLATS